MDMPVEVCPRCRAEIGGLVAMCPACGYDLLGAATSGVSKFATVVFCDLVDSTPLLGRIGTVLFQRFTGAFHRAASRTLGTHGGRVNRLLEGDAVMAVFGVPVINDDDALRATRAAVELRDAVKSLSDGLERLTAERHPEGAGERCEARITIATGDVLVGTDERGEEQLTGEPLILAARLKEAADPSQILLADATWQLVRTAVEAEPAGPFELAGFPQPVPAHALQKVDPGRGRRFDGPLIGRERELRLLLDTFERVEAMRRCHLVTVFGDSGVGKSRLVDELTRAIGERAKVLWGNTQSSGEGITFWPMLEIVNQAVDAPAASAEALAARIDEAVADEDDAERIARHVKQLLGLRERGVLAGDTAWALRRFMEALARHRPVVVVVDDLQWAEPALLDTLDHIAESTAEVPLLVVCVARPELLSRRMSWAGGKLNAASLQLPPLTGIERDQLMVHLLGGKDLEPAARRHIDRLLTEGYPFFIEELVTFLINEHVLQLQDGRWRADGRLDEARVPAAIHARLATRIDRLEPEEREVVERAAIIGEQFHTADLVALSQQADRDTIERLLEALVREALIRRDYTGTFFMPVDPGQAYSFRDGLIREVTYNQIPEGRRALLHQSYADWVQEAAGERLSQFDEMIGHHLRLAVRYRRSGGASQDDTRELATRSADRLTAAGRRAAARGDLAAAARLLDQAVELLPEQHPARPATQLELADALRESDLRRAVATYRAIIGSASGGGDAPVHHARMGLLEVTWYHDPGRVREEGMAQVEQAIEAFERLGDALGLAKAWRMHSWISYSKGLSHKAAEGARKAIGHAVKAQDEQWEARVRRHYLPIVFWGPAPLEEVERHCNEELARARRSGMRGLEAAALATLARTTAMRGDFDDARRHFAAASTITSDLGELLTSATDCITAGLIEQLAGNLPGSEEVLRRGFMALDGMDGRGPAANVAAMLARVLLLQARDDDAIAMTETSRQLTSESQMDTRVKWRSVRAVALARKGRGDQAMALIEEAMALVQDIEQPDTKAETHLDHAEVLRAAARREEALLAADRAIRLYEAKGNRVAANRARTLRITLSR